MSIEAIGWALNVPVGGNQKVILLGLANHAHPDGTEAYPSLDTLARYAHCHRSTARRNVRELVEQGWAIEDGMGPSGTVRYRLPVWIRGHETGGVPKCDGVAPAFRGGSTSVREGVAPVLPEPSIEPSKNRPLSLERARERTLTWRGRRVPAETLEVVDRLLDVFAEATGQSRRSVSARRQVAGAVMARPDVSVEIWEAGIRGVVASPPDWWDGPPQIGHVFGERAAEWTIRAAEGPTQTRSGSFSRPRSTMDHYADMAAHFERQEQA